MSRFNLWVKHSLMVILSTVLVAMVLAQPASASDDIPYGPQSSVQQFTTPGGITYYSLEALGHLETGRTMVVVPSTGFPSGKSVRLVLTDAVYGVQEVRLKPEGDGPPAAPFCTVPPRYRYGSVGDVPPGYQKQELIAYYPDADGSEYALRYDVNWYVGTFSASSTAYLSTHFLRTGEQQIKLLKKQRRSTWRALRVLKRERRVVRLHGNYAKARVQTHRIMKKKRRIKFLARQIRKLDAQQRAAALQYQTCPQGPYTTP